MNTRPSCRQGSSSSIPFIFLVVLIATCIAILKMRQELELSINSRPVSIQNQCEFILARYLRTVDNVARSLLPMQYSFPTNSTPFIFYLLRKTGSRTLQKNLLSYAKRQQVSSYFACHDTACEAYGPPEQFRPPVSLLAGHFYFPTVEKWTRLTAFGDKPRATVERVHRRSFCFVMLRHPVDRVRSCWNYRFVVEARGQSELRNFTFSSAATTEKATFEKYLATAEDIYGDGCNNEALRIMSNLGRSNSKISSFTSDGRSTALTHLMTL